ncbi:MAG: thiamine ABC transporter substrate-binding protein, partial [Candidatus Cloacimonadota bacterium]|nr:thiamine ABC transporter substrate-binding protein [Candidatus Cloacimonadota bacterium]
MYTYDSLGWIEDQLVKDFEEKNDCELKIVKFSNTGKILARAKLEKVNPRGDVIIGLTPTSTEQAKKEDLLEKLGYIENKKNISNKDIIFDKDGFVLPYDFGALAIIINPENMKFQPKSFEDITKMKKKLIMQDPRTSTTGQDFLLWTIAAYGEGWKDFWKKLKPAILTVVPGWSESFAKFETGEAPMM